MTTSTWLLDHLVAQGHVTETGASRKAKVRSCRKCGTRILVGLDADMCALEIEADPTPLSALGEAIALIEGRRTFALCRDRGRYVLDPRRPEDITDAPAATSTFQDALREHRCHTNLPDAYTAPRPSALFTPPIPADAPPPRSEEGIHDNPQRARRLVRGTQHPSRTVHPPLAAHAATEPGPAGRVQRGCRQGPPRVRGPPVRSRVPALARLRLATGVAVNPTGVTLPTTTATIGLGPGRMKTAPKGAETPLRSLTHPDRTNRSEGFVKPTTIATHNAWTGRPVHYQERARLAFSIHYDRQVLPWAWITSRCDVAMCLRPECMAVHAPKRIAYPDGVCVYCGDPAGTMDHLLPRPATGDALRGQVALVPSCGNCNSRICDFPSPNIGDRRRRAQLSIERGYRLLLASPHKDAEYLRHIGPALKSVAIKNNAKRVWVKLRLSWPDDPFYDLRAFQQSGVEDPVAIGMCDRIATPLRDEYREASA